MASIACSVDNCTFWKQGNKCGAEKIEVNNMLGEQRAYKSDETSCKTFKPRYAM